jgi:hypothetical protein
VRRAVPTTNGRYQIETLKRLPTVGGREKLTTANKGANGQ